MPLWNTPGEVKAAFFDADGTLISPSTNHRIPESTQVAISELRKEGVKCFLATGRPPYQCDEIPIDNFEGFILFNGQLVLTRDEILFSECLDRDDVATVVQQVHEGKYHCLFMERGRCYIDGHDGLVRSAEEFAGLTYEEGNIDQALHNDIYQLNVFLGPGETGVLTEATNSFKVTRWSPNFVDVFPRHGGKARAVRRVLDIYDISPEEAIAFGDGGNDLEMFGTVGTSIAMGNGNPEVREQADYVTDDIAHDGIYNACFRLGLVREA